MDFGWTTPVMNRLFEAFVKATGYVTFVASPSASLWHGGD
jgi:hypothetical protein